MGAVIRREVGSPGLQGLARPGRVANVNAGA